MTAPDSTVRVTILGSGDAFAAGVLHGLLAGLDAQETLELAEQDILTSAFSHNLAKAVIARAMGRAENSMLTMLDHR